METLRHISQWLGGQHEAVVWQVLGRLILAAILGGAIGMERELKRRPAGLRTNLFICFGAAMFTILSDQFASHFGGDHARIAAQIIPGIGFIGAGSILHDRGSVTGLTTAATIFVVASVGMAAGGGFYLLAVFATVVILIALYTLGQFERRLNLKTSLVTYEVMGSNANDVLAAINRALEKDRHTISGLQINHEDGQRRIQFTVDATSREHKYLLDALRKDDNVSAVQAFGAEERD